MRRVAHPRMVPEHAAQEALAILERHIEQRSTIEVEQIERLVHDAGGGRVAEFGLQEAEVGSAFVIERDHLAIDDGLRRFDPARRVEELGEVGRRILEVARPDADLPVIEHGLDPKAVPLDLEQPVLVVERLAREGRQHRIDVLRELCRFGGGEVDLGGGRGCLADPDRVAVGLDLVVGPAGLDALRMVLGVPARLGGVVVLVDEQPLLALVALEWSIGRLAGAAARADDRESTLELLAVDAELELAVIDGLLRVQGGRLRFPRAPVPDDDVAGTVLLGRDDPLEVEILDRVVLDVDRHASGLGVEARALGDGPADEDAIDLEAEVVVEPRGPMPLHDESTGRAGDRGGRGLRGLGEVSLAAIFVEGHDGECASAGPRVCEAAGGAEVARGTLEITIRVRRSPGRESDGEVPGKSVMSAG